MSTITVIDPQQVGYNVQEIANKVGTLSSETKTAIDARPAWVVQEWTDAVAASANGLKLAAATQVAPLTVTSFLAGGVAALLAYPRNVTFTTAGVTPADAPANAVVTGTDIDGNALTETITVAQTATISAGVKAFKTITSVAFAAADGTAATVAIGFGDVLGLSASIATRAGRLAVLQEVAGGSVVTTGTFVSPTTSPPHGTYDPAAALDGSVDFALTYEQS
jgi:hypothetical protein